MRKIVSVSCEDDRIEVLFCLRSLQSTHPHPSSVSNFLSFEIAEQRAKQDEEKNLISLLSCHDACALCVFTLNTSQGQSERI
jgi:hypothetical protein